MPGRRLVLASTSRYRRELLARLRLPFDVDPPEVDERPRSGEAPAATASRLALAKASAVAARHADAVPAGASPERGRSSTSGGSTSNGRRRRASSSRR